MTSEPRTVTQVLIDQDLKHMKLTAIRQHMAGAPMLSEFQDDDDAWFQQYKRWFDRAQELLK